MGAVRIPGAHPGLVEQLHLFPNEHGGCCLAKEQLELRAELGCCNHAFAIDR